MKIKFSFFEVTLFVVSSIVISNQIALMQLFAYQQWYHFAAVIISMALIGFGISGLIVPTIKKNVSNNLQLKIYWILVFASISFPLSLIINQEFFGSFDSYLIFFDLKESIKFLLIIINFTLIFTLLALVIGVIFSFYSHSISKLYFWNLTGSAFGGFFVLILLKFFLPQQILVLNGLIISLVLLLRQFVERTKNLKFGLLLTISFLMNIFFLFAPLEFKPSQFKSISRLKNLPDCKIEYQKASPYGFIEKISSSLLRFSPGLSLNYCGEIPKVNSILINGDVVGYELIKSDKIDNSFLKNTTLFLPYSLRKFNDVLILNSMGGIEINRALIGSAKEVYVTELNPLLLKLVEKQFSKTEKSTLKFFRTDSRIFLETFNQKFDLIYHSVIEPVGLVSGLYSVQEKYLLTKESFQKIYDHLNPSGYFSISCYIDNPARTFLKVLNLFLSIRDENGNLLTAKQLIGINNWNVITFILKKGNFTKSEIIEIQRFCELNQFDFSIHPEKKVVLPKFNLIWDNQTLEIVKDILNRDEKFFKDYLFDISAPQDDRPYFSNFLRLKNFNFYLQNIPLRILTYSEVGYFLIWISFGLVLILASLLLIFGFITIKIKEKTKIEILVYFGLIGIAFMLIELSLIQKFTFIFSTDIFSISFVISSLLIFSGIGSLLIEKFLTKKLFHYLVFSAIILYGLLLLNLKSFWIEVLVSQNLILKFLLSALLIFPLGLFMGMPFPFGIKFFTSKELNVVPFAWAINGSFSVIGSIGAVILLVNFGFYLTFLIALTLYLICALFFIIKKLKWSRD